LIDWKKENNKVRHDEKRGLLNSIEEFEGNLVG